MKIAIDMDNTIIDELDATLRPGIDGFLRYLSSRHELYLWSNSTRSRVYDEMTHFALRPLFVKIIAREDYDPKFEGLPKDIASRGIDILIDDDPNEIDFVNKSGRKGILVKSYRKDRAMDSNELQSILKKHRL